MPPDMLANRYSRRDLESVRRTVFDEISNKPITLRERMDLSKTKLRKFERNAAEDAHLLDKANNKRVSFEIEGKKKKKNFGLSYQINKQIVLLLISNFSIFYSIFLSEKSFFNFFFDIIS